MQLTKQGVRDLDSLDRNKPYVPPSLTGHVCQQWRWFNPPKGETVEVTVNGKTERQEAAPEIRCIVCKKPWYKTEKPAVAPQVESLEKIAPGLKKIPKAKKVPLTTTKPSLKAPLIDIMK